MASNETLSRTGSMPIIPRNLLSTDKVGSIGSLRRPAVAVLLGILLKSHMIRGSYNRGRLPEYITDIQKQPILDLIGRVIYMFTNKSDKPGILQSFNNSILNDKYSPNQMPGIKAAQQYGSVEAASLQWLFNVARHSNIRNKKSLTERIKSRYANRIDIDTDRIIM